MPLSAAAQSVAEAIARAAEAGTTFDRSFRSSALRTLSYNPITGTLTLQFTGGNIGYIYFDVPLSIVARFLASRSKGVFYHQNIKTQFRTP